MGRMFCNYNYCNVRRHGKNDGVKIRLNYFFPPTASKKFLTEKSLKSGEIYALLLHCFFIVKMESKISQFVSFQAKT